MTITGYKKAIANLIKTYRKKYDVFGNKRKEKKRAKR